jgi:predicted ribosomally synthesized peptide with SipW-like signal peptide
MSKKIGLTRRQALAGLGTIGIASAGAGLGTTALFSDEESFDGNTITAGTLDMSVTATVEAANDYWKEQVTLEDLEATADGEAVTGLQVNDVKPGDWGIICFEIDVGDNPGYVRTTTEGLTTSENGYTEPEPTEGDDENDPNDEDGAGELQDFMLAEVYRSFDASDDSDPPRSHLSPSGGDPVAPEGSTVWDTYTTFSTGVPMLESDGSLMEVGSGADAAEWCLLLYLPEDVGNRVQSDGFSFDLVFEAEQVRNNDNPFQPLVLDGGTAQGQGAGFANPWDTTTSVAHSGSGAWGTVDHSPASSYKQGFYFPMHSLPDFTVSDIDDVSYWLYEPTALDGVDIYLNIYTAPEGDGDDAASWYDSRLQALPSEANGGSPNFTPGSWNEFSTESGASNTLTWSDTGRGGNFNQPLPELADIQSGSVDWSTYGANASFSHDYSDEEVWGLSLQVGSQSGIDLEAYIDDVRVELASGDVLEMNLEP